MRDFAEEQTRQEVLGASGLAVWTWPSVVAVDAGCYANSIEGKGEVCSVARLRCGARPSIAPSKEASETRKDGEYGR